MNDALKKAVEKAKQMRAEGTFKRMTHFEKWERKKNSLRLSINAMCEDCQGGNSDPHLKWRIGNCECEDSCPLFQVRPHQAQWGIAVKSYPSSPQLKAPEKNVSVDV